MTSTEYMALHVRAMRWTLYAHVDLRDDCAAHNELKSLGFSEDERYHLTRFAVNEMQLLVEAVPGEHEFLLLGINGVMLAQPILANLRDEGPRFADRMLGEGLPDTDPDEEACEDAQ